VARAYRVSPGAWWCARRTLLILFPTSRRTLRALFPDFTAHPAGYRELPVLVSGGARGAPCWFCSRLHGAPYWFCSRLHAAPCGLPGTAGTG